MADPYSPFTLGAAAGAVAADPSLAPFGGTTALAEELLRLVRTGGDRTALAEELLAMASGTLPDVSRATDAEQAMGAVIDYERALGRLAPYAPMAAGVLRALHRGGDRIALGAQLAAPSFAGLIAEPAGVSGAGEDALRGVMGANGVKASGGEAGAVRALASSQTGSGPGIERANAQSVAAATAASASADMARASGMRTVNAPGAAHASKESARSGAFEPRQSVQAAGLIAQLAGGHRLLEIDTALPGAFLVERYSGHEAVCAAFRFEVDCLSLSAFLDTRALLGQPVTLRQRRADDTWRQWHGLCTRVAPLGGDGGYARYRLTIEPWTALLALRRNALIFQDQDVRGVLEQVFVHYPQADWRIEVSQPLTRRPVTTQYREDDWSFVTRLLAEAGLGWRFEHRQGATGRDAPTHTLVVFDREATVPDAAPSALRFHRSNATEREDAITGFTHQQQMTADAVSTASWAPQRVEALSATTQAQSVGAHLPRREVFRMNRADRFADAGSAAQSADLLLDALRVPQRLHAGAGTGRGLQPGHAFALTDHPDLAGQRFIPLVIEHVATNNLGTGIVAILDDPELERGSYRNRFLAAPAETPLVPYPRSRPTAPGAQTARVVGLPGAAVTSTRDHQVRIQFPWQRGTSPHAGGLTDTGSYTQVEGHAPGDESSGTWVRVAEWLAGPNWGTHTLPRIGSEVLVEFLHGDIDQPVVTGQLYNGEVAPPFALAENTNHPGTLSGLHTQSLDGSGTQQWLMDDASGQLRERLHTSLADSRLELGYLIEHGNAHRGAYRGEGFDLATLGWANLRAGHGMLLSTTLRPGAASTQFDVSEAVAQLHAAIDTAQALHDAARAHDAAALGANPAQAAFVRHIDAARDGKYTAPAGGQPTTRPAGDARDGGEPVERFAEPVLLAESADSIVLATPASALAYAGANLHMTVQSDAHFVAGHTWSAVSGGSASLFAQTGPIRVIAANGPVSLQAHAGTLELLADQSVTVTATDERIDVLARKKIVLQAGQSQITLEGRDITFACPGNFTVKASEHPFWGGASKGASLKPLPEGALPPDTLYLDHRYHDDEGLGAAEYLLRLANGRQIRGTLDGQGRAVIPGITAGGAEVSFSPMPGQFARKDQTPTPAHDPDPSDKKLAGLVARYLGERPNIDHDGAA